MLLGQNVKRIFITGGAGFIGSHICDRLISDGYFVTAFDNLSNGRFEFLSKHIDNKNFNFIHGDCLDLDKITISMRNHDLVWHMAANTDIIGSHAEPDRDLNDCVVATFNVLEAMRINQIKPILFASSGAVYGKLCLDDYVDESAGPLSPMSAYAAGKISSEAFIQCYSHLYGLRGWIFRFGNVIGSRVTHGVLFDFINKLKKNPEELLILGDGTQEKNYFLTEECIEGIGWSFDNISLDSNKSSEILNLGTDSVTTVMEIAEIVINEMGLSGKTKIKIQGERYAWLGDQPRVHLNVSKINTLGWKCKYSSSESVKLAVRRILSEEK